MNPFLYAWAKQNYVLMLVDKHGLSSCLKKELPHIAWTVYCLVPYENHVNITKTLGQGQKVECKGFTYKDFKYTPVYWDRCQAKLGK